MTKIKRTTQTLFGIPIFSWEDWDQIDTDVFNFYNIIFSFPLQSMRKYNGCDCSLDLNGDLIITKTGEEIEKDLYKTEIVWSGLVCDIPEFMEKLNKKHKG